MRSEELIKRLENKVKDLKENATFLTEEIDFFKDEGRKLLVQNNNLTEHNKEILKELRRVSKLKNEMQSDLHKLLDNPFKSTIRK